MLTRCTRDRLSPLTRRAAVRVLRVGFLVLAEGEGARGGLRSCWTQRPRRASLITLSKEVYPLAPPDTPVTLPRASHRRLARVFLSQALRLQPTVEDATTESNMASTCSAVMGARVGGTVTVRGATASRSSVRPAAATTSSIGWRGGCGVAGTYLKGWARPPPSTSLFAATLSTSSIVEVP